MMSMRSIVLASVGGLGVCATSYGAIIPFTETFSSSAANWSSASAFTPLNYPASGGPDGSGYGSAPFTFTSGSSGNPISIFRGNDSFGASGGAFVGDWLGGGATAFTFSVRHNAPFSLQFFGRFLGVNAFTGAAYSFPGSVLAPNTWATFTVPLSNFTTDPNWVAEGAPTLFNSTFTNVGKVQVGVWGDANTASQNGPWTFDIDNVGLIPAPGAAALLGVAGLGALRRRRR